MKINMELTDGDNEKIEVLKYYYGYSQTSELIRYLLTIHSEYALNGETRRSYLNLRHKKKGIE